MDHKPLPPRTRTTRIIELSALGIALLAAFLAGAWSGPGLRPLVVNWFAATPPGMDVLPSDQGSIATATNTTIATKRIAQQEERRTAAARETFVREDAGAIVAECQRAAGGDWAKWEQETTAYRQALKAKIGDSKGSGLRGLEGSRLFEVNAGENLNYLWEPARMNVFRRDRPVVAVDRWLRRRGIDLIFVPVPKLTEIFVEQFLNPCPPDGITAPHVRRTLLELLENQVEVVDGFRLFRAFRDSDTEFLYQVGDTHWGRRGKRIMAKQLADRIERYPFGARARYCRQIVGSPAAPVALEGSLAQPNALLPLDQGPAPRAPLTNRADLREQESQPFPDDPTSPVLLIGNSYARGFREQFIKELNLLLNTRIYDGGTTEFFTDFLREPELLAHCRVVVWITTEQHMTRFKPLPAHVMAALDASE